MDRGREGMELTPSKVPVRRPAKHFVFSRLQILFGFRLHAVLVPIIDHTETVKPKHTKCCTTVKAMMVLAGICMASRASCATRQKGKAGGYLTALLNPKRCISNQKCQSYTRNPKVSVHRILHEHTPSSSLRSIHILS